MFHTFSTQTEKVTAEAKQVSGSLHRRISIARACEPCRRRKVKCNGEVPCETCQWYRKPAQCHYTDHNQRTTTSRPRLGDKTTHSLLHQYKSIFQKLFSTQHPEQLLDLTREELVDLIARDSPRAFLRPASPLTPSIDDLIPHIHPDADSLETFQPMPEEGSESSDQYRSKALLGIQDDVNALSLSVKQTSSYLGISSVMAVLRIIAWLDPEAQAVFRRTPEASMMCSREASLPSTPIQSEDADRQPQGSSNAAWDEIPHINAYFTFFHPMIPLLDEQAFRDTYIIRHRSDPRWLLLLNVVLALGCAINGTANDTTHKMYYARAQRYLNMETFGSAHLETVQALTLLSGYYLHYLQLPNQANAMMGMTLRLATALGLHRDYPETVALATKEEVTLSIELRRRIWWCIFSLDSWACCPLGRPAMGRISNAITAKSPQQPIGGSTQILALLQENIQFNLISTKAEDTLAVSPMIDEKERTFLDTAYTDWFKTSSVQDTTPKPSTAGEAIGISVTKNIMRWRYWWARIILHRPTLLWSTMRKTRFCNLAIDRQTTIELCRDLTSDLINDIAMTWAGRKACVMSAWHATWLLYQATMVPLLALFSDCTEDHVLEKSHALVQISMRVLSDQIEYTHTARRSLEVISLIYEAGQAHCSLKQQNATSRGIAQIGLTSPRPTTEDLQPNLTNMDYFGQLTNSRNSSTPGQETIVNNMFNHLNWSTGWMDGSNDWVDFANLDFSVDTTNTNMNVMDAQYLESMSAFEPAYHSYRPDSTQMDTEGSQS